MIDVHDADPWNTGENRCRFIKACYRENIGWYALALCIAGADRYEVLDTFCGIHTNLDNKRRRHRQRKDVVPIDLEKLRTEMRLQNISQRKLAELLKVSRPRISTMFSEGRKRKVFVNKIEKVLNLPEGALIIGEDNK